MKKKQEVPQTRLARFDKTELVFYAVVSLVPLAFWPDLAAPTNAKIPIVTAVAGLMLAALLWRAAVDRRFRLPKSPLVYPVLVALAWKVVSTGYGRHLYASIEPLAQAAIYTIVFFGVTLVNRPGQIRRLVSVMACAAIPVCAFGILERFGIRLPGVADVYNGRIYSTTGNPTFLAAYLGLLLPSQLGLFILAKPGWKQWLFGVAVSLAYLCVIWSYTRGIYVGLALALPVMLALMLAGPERHLLRTRLVPVTALLIVLPLLTGVSRIAGPSPSHASSHVVQSTRIGSRSSDTLRLSLMRAGVEMFRDHLLLGVGLGGYQVHYLNYIKTKPIPGNYLLGQDHAHNELVEVAAEEGIPGLAICAWLFAATCATVTGGLKRARMHGDAQTSLLLCGLAAGLIAFSGDMMVNVGLHELHVGVFAWLVLGMLSVLAVSVRHNDAEESPAPRPVPERVALIALGVVGLLALSFLGVKALMADVYTYDAGLAQKRLDWEGAIRNNEAALRQNPYSPMPLYWLGIAYREAGYIEDSLKVFERYQSLYPHSNRIDFELGRTLFALGEYQVAAGSYREAVLRDHADFPALQGLAACYYLLGRRDDAHKAAAKAVRLGGDVDAAREYGVATIEDSSGQLHYQIAAEIVRVGLYEQAIPELQEAVEAEPRNAEFLTTLGAAYSKLSRMPEAEATLKAAIQADDGSAQPHAYLGVVYLQTGRKAMAEREIGKAVSLSPDAQSKSVYESLLRRVE